jgi:hypothetical protein
MCATTRAIAESPQNMGRPVRRYQSVAPSE